MQIQRFTFNPFQVNCYVVYNESKDCLIVDASCYEKSEMDELTGFIESRGLTPRLLVNTHGHVDHLPGNTFIAKKYSLDISMHKDDLFLLNSAVEQGLFFGFNITRPPDPTFFPVQGDLIPLGSNGLEVRHAPGHSPGSIVLYSAEGNFIITGDVLFAGSIGRTDLPGGDYNVLINSIHTQLLDLPGHTIVYPGHGPPTTIEKEKQINPFLK